MTKRKKYSENKNRNKNRKKERKRKKNNKSKSVETLRFNCGSPFYGKVFRFDESTESIDEHTGYISKLNWIDDFIGISKKFNGIPFVSFHESTIDKIEFLEEPRKQKKSAILLELKSDDADNKEQKEEKSDLDPSEITPF